MSVSPWLWLALALLPLADGPSCLPRRSGLVTPSGPEWPLSHTWTGTQTDGWTWERSRAAGLRPLLAARIASATALERGIKAIIAQWWIETARGRAEWNWNPGNLRAFQSTTAPWTRFHDGLPYRAFASMADGIAAYLGTITGARYRESWSLLSSGGDSVAWYDKLLREGYSNHSQASVNEFRSVLSRVTV